MSLINLSKTMQKRLQLGVEFGEKISRYFLGLKKWHNDKKFIKVFEKHTRRLN